MADKSNLLEEDKFSIMLINHPTVLDYSIIPSILEEFKILMI